MHFALGCYYFYPYAYPKKKLPSENSPGNFTLANFGSKQQHPHAIGTAWKVSPGRPKAVACSSTLPVSLCVLEVFTRKKAFKTFIAQESKMTFLFHVFPKETVLNDN
jgi:hypothetical protein